MNTIISAPYLLPREKMHALGAEALTNAELLAIILSVGTRKESVFSIAKRVFPYYGATLHYTNKTPAYLSHALDIPLSHATKLAAFFELAKRENSTYKALDIRSSKDIAARYMYISKYAKEHVIGIYTNTRNTIIHEEVLSIGTVNLSLVSPKEVLEPAIRTHAVFVFLCHNHPSGDPLPSQSDITVTQKISLACKIIGIPLIDHLVIGGEKWMSLRDLGHIS